MQLKELNVMDPTIRTHCTLSRQRLRYLKKRISSGHITAYFQRTDSTDMEQILDREPTLRIPSWFNMTLRFRRFGTRPENSGARGTISMRNQLLSGMRNIFVCKHLFIQEDCIVFKLF